MKHLMIVGLMALGSLTPAFAHHMDGAQQTNQGLAVTDGFARATLPGAPVGGAYVTLQNNGAEDDRLIAVSSPAAGRMEIHDMLMEGDMMKMVPLPDGLPIAAGETVVLQPMGKHLMLMDLKSPLIEGDTVEITLTFEHADPLTVELPVAKINAAASGHGH